MIRIESRILDYRIDGASRLSVLERLQGQELIPLIRAARLHVCELALSSGAEQAREMERALAARAEIEGDAAYMRGDIFCVEDYAHFLIFDDAPTGEGEGVRAGIVYESETLLAPLEKLDAFCREVSAALQFARSDANGAQNGDGVDAAPLLLGGWRKRKPRAAAESFRRFAATVAAEGSPANARAEMVEGSLRAAGMLEDAEARGFLRRLSEAHYEGRGGSSSSGTDGGRVPDALLGKLAEAGLLKREILVSCRKDGRALFRLPSPDAFGILSGSNAICNECGASIADEKAEEINVPTPLAAMLLQDGAWLATHLRATLSQLGVPEDGIVSRIVSGESEAELMANVCGKPFLFIVRDGDWTTAHARRALDEHAKIESTHLVLIANGKILDEARQRLREHARRRTTQNGRELELILIEGMETIAAELQPAFERAAAKALSTELWELDTSLGVNAGQLIATRFNLLRRPESLLELAASATTTL